MNVFFYTSYDDPEIEINEGKKSQKEGTQKRSNEKTAVFIRLWR